MVLPMQESFFFHFTLPKHIKLTKELITLNYKKFSPLKNPLILSVLIKEELYIWFSKKPLKTTPIIIPEAYILYLATMSKKDGIHIFHTPVKRFLIIKNGILYNAFTTTENYEQTLKLLIQENDLKTIYQYSHNEYETIYEEGLKKLTLQELQRFLQVSLKKEQLGQYLLDIFTYPLVLFMILYMLITYSQSYLLSQQITKKEQEYLSLKKQNTTVKKAIREHNQKIDEMKNFIQKNIYIQDPFSIIYALYSVITPKDKATIDFLEITQNTMRLRLKTNENPIKYLNRFNKLPFFTNVIIQNSFKRKNIKTITYILEIKSYNAKS